MLNSLHAVLLESIFHHFVVSCVTFDKIITKRDSWKILVPMKLKWTKIVGISFMLNVEINSFGLVLLENMYHVSVVIYYHAIAQLENITLANLHCYPYRCVSINSLKKLKAISKSSLVRKYIQFCIPSSLW